MDNKKRIDKTSIVMIVLFVVIVLGTAIGVFLWKSRKDSDNSDQPTMIDEQTVSEHKNDDGLLTVEDIMQIVPDAKPGTAYSYFDDNGDLQTIVIPEDYEAQKEQKLPSKYKFEKFEDLSDKFFEVCKAGDVNDLYHLYYDGILEDMRLNMKEVPDKATFDAGLRENMLSVTGFDEYEFGCPELPPTQSPGSYASYIYSRVNNGKQLPISASQIENCVNLVVYIDNMYQTNHFMIQVDGLWYFIV